MPRALLASIPGTRIEPTNRSNPSARRSGNVIGNEPETYASHAYDGMNMLIWAIQAAGLNRAKIRDMIAYRTEPWKGVTGDIVFSSVLDDIGEVYLAKREQGAWKYLFAQELGLPCKSAGAGPDLGAYPVLRRHPASDGLRRPWPRDRGAGRTRGGPHRLSSARPIRQTRKATIPGRLHSWPSKKPTRREAVRESPSAWFPHGRATPWADGAARLAHTVYDDQVWAIVGGIDGPTTHMAEQIAVKARLPLVNPFSSDKTVNRAGVPWVFSCTPGDDLVAPVLADEIATRSGDKPFVLVSADGHDARLFSEEISNSLSRLHLAPQLRFEYKPQEAILAELAARILHSPETGRCCDSRRGAADSAKLVKGLRAAGYKGYVFGGPWMGRRQFEHDAGAAGEGCLFPLLFAAEKTV